MYNVTLLSKGNNQWITVYREIFAPDLFSPLSSALLTVEFKTGWIPMSSINWRHNCVWANSRRGETVCKWRRARKLHGAKITLYTVSHLGYDESSNFFFLIPNMQQHDRKIQLYIFIVNAIFSYWNLWSWMLGWLQLIIMLLHLK